jgi:hypothetical protein
VGSLCPVRAAKPYTVVAETPTSKPAAVTARVELAGGNHLVLDAARAQRSLNHADHLLL